MDTSFSIDLHDADGDAYERCILLHVSDTAILKFKSLQELSAFADSLPATIKEIKENYPNRWAGGSEEKEDGR